ncbi:MAG TPA: reverse transcriptase family protein, partial [Bacteroidia bacterium]|nr:reverse transcriptase family protein [Bacteroidia bacterium]
MLGIVGGAKIRDPSPECFRFSNISSNDVISKAKTAKANMGGCLTHMSGELYKRHIKVIADILATLFTHCLREGICPLELKYAVVTPVLKKGSPKTPNNYRPISNVPFLAKLLESLINDQVKIYLDQLFFIHPKQFGFRGKCNTSLALAHLQKYITKTWEENKIVAAIFIDVEKAFDSVDKSILLNILRQIKFSEEAVCFFDSYFYDRVQVTRNGNVTSEPMNIKLGTPQGTSLSPTLFTIFVNSLLNSSSLSPICFADDVSLLAPVNPNDHQHSTSLINELLTNIMRWYETHRLAINVSKTKVMVFSTRQRSTPRLNDFILNGTILQCVSTLKLLGMTLDTSLTFRSHILNIVNTLKFIIPSLGRLYNSGIPT